MRPPCDVPSKKGIRKTPEADTRHCPRCDRTPDEGQELCRFCIMEDDAIDCGINQVTVNGNDSSLDPIAKGEPFTLPTIGTGTGSEVVDIVRQSENTYLATTKDGRQEVVDEATLKQLPQGIARLATLQTREKMAAKLPSHTIPQATDDGDASHGTLDEPGGGAYSSHALVVRHGR